MPTLSLALGVAVAACGPAITPEPENGSSSSGEATASTSTSTSTTTTTAPGTSSTTAVADTGETTDSSSTGFDTGSDDDNGASSVGFYGGPAPDGVTSFECDVWEQDCDNGEKCMPWANDGGDSWNATRCTPVSPSAGGPGDPCTVEGSGVSGVDSCDIGVMCFYVDAATNEGECVAMCTGTPAMPLCDDVDDTCVSTNEGVLNLCLDECDPLMQDCPGGRGCLPWDETFICAPTSPAAADYGEACVAVDSCAPGLVCGGNGCGGLSCCTEYCDHTGANTCPEAGSGQECVALLEPAESPVGLCMFPD